MSKNLESLIGKHETVNKVKSRIDELVTRKKCDLKDIAKKSDDIRAEIETITQVKEKASAQMDSETYVNADFDLERKNKELDMVNARYEQIENLKIVSDDESVAVMDSLVNYEKQLDDAFDQDVTPLLDKIRHLMSIYMEEIDNTESVIKAWTISVHKNYYDRNNHRFSDRPIPPTFGNWGDALYIRLRDCLERIDDIGHAEELRNRINKMRAEIKNKKTAPTKEEDISKEND